MNRAFDAWHLPGLERDELAITTYEIGDLAVRAPALVPEQLNRVIAHIAAARQHALVRASTPGIVAAIDAAAARIADRASAEGGAARELLPAVTGYSLATVEDILQHMTNDWRADSLRTLLRSEFGAASSVDEPIRDLHTGRLLLMRGPQLAFQIFSGNVPGVAVTSLVRALLVKAASLGKTASGEPVLPIIFMQALAAIAPQFAECIAITYWPGGSESLEAVALHAADMVVVYGSDETVQFVTQRSHPDTRLVVHGPKLSIGIVGRSATVADAAAIASATAAYDQQGCVSPHVVYVERGGNLEPKELARAVADALADLELRQPRRKLSHAEALTIRKARAHAEFRGLAGGDSDVFGSDDTSYTVIYDDDPVLIASCLNRTLYVKPIANVDDVPALLAPHRAVLQSAALAGLSAAGMNDLARALADCGITRITTFNDLPWPRMWWHHDGRGPLQELLTWHDVEV
jgi:hypothetical protein